MNITFLTPHGAVVGLAVLAPLFFLFFASRQNQAVATRLGLTTISGREWLRGVFKRILRKESNRAYSHGPVWVRRGALLLSVGVLAGLAASQPAVSFPQSTAVCSGAEVVMVFDTSRSMSATTSFEASTRLERARMIAKRMRDAVDCVPVGVASWTDRVLPHLFPTADHEAFVSVVDNVIDIEHPPPAGIVDVRSTSLSALSGLAEADFFTPQTTDKKIVVVFTDGESIYFSPQVLAITLRQVNISVMFVHVWGPHERVFTPEGKPEIYRSDPAAVAEFKHLIRIMKSPLVAEEQRTEAVSELQKQIGNTERSPSEKKPREIFLAPYLIALAMLASAMLLSRNIFTVASAFSRKRRKN